ncbi:MAG: hypothetical protein ABI142_09960 [Bryocella sp.]
MSSRATKQYLQMALRIVVGLLAVAVLLAPAYVMALVYTSLNFVVAVAAILLVVLCSRFRRARWWLAVVGALLIAVPPYPFWAFTDNQGAWFLNFFHGFTLHTAPIATFCIYFVLALALFGVLFRVLPRSGRYAGV